MTGSSHSTAPSPPPPATTRGWLDRPGVLPIWCLVAAFGAYACMYGLRKPFTAGTYLAAPFGEGFKAWLVTAQVLGYTVSKFIGIRVIASLPHSLRVATLLGLFAVAEIALVLFAVAPRPLGIVCLFLNGLPLGMVFGLVLGFLEGRRLTEAFVAGLCASFILADGVAKTVGAQLLARGAVAGTGILTPEEAFDPATVLEQMRLRDIVVHDQVEAIDPG